MTRGQRGRLQTIIHSEAIRLRMRDAVQDRFERLEHDKAAAQRGEQLLDQLGSMVEDSLRAPASLAHNNTIGKFDGRQEKTA